MKKILIASCVLSFAFATASFAEGNYSGNGYEQKMDMLKQREQQIQQREQYLEQRHQNMEQYREQR